MSQLGARHVTRRFHDRSFGYGDCAAFDARLPRFRAFAHSANRATRNLCMCIIADFRAEEPAVVSAEGDTIVLSPVSNVTQLSSRNPRPLSAPGACMVVFE